MRSTAVLGINDLQDVLTHTWDLRSLWDKVGLALKIDYGTLEAIKRNNRDQCDDCFIAVISKWLRRNTPAPCWKELAVALNSPTLNTLIFEGTIYNVFFGINYLCVHPIPSFLLLLKECIQPAPFVPHSMVEKVNYPENDPIGVS